jgi:TonB family protein
MLESARIEGLFRILASLCFPYRLGFSIHLIDEWIVPHGAAAMHCNRSEKRMKLSRYVIALLVLTAASLGAQEAGSLSRQVHQTPDQDGVYYVGPEVASPRLVRTVPVPYPDAVSGKDIQGMTVLAMVIDAKGIPQHIQVLHTHGDTFDRGAVAAVKQSVFEPGALAGKPVPVWIDVRVVFHANRSQALPQVLITERDLPPPDPSELADKHHKPLSYTPPFPIHTVDADFTDPFAKNPYVQVAIVSVLVSEEGLPKEVRVRRGLGFGMDKKAETAVWHYRFLSATSKGRPIEARRDVMVSFVKF